jgi:hypothetical protein
VKTAESLTADVQKSGWYYSATFAVHPASTGIKNEGEKDKPDLQGITADRSLLRDDVMRYAPAGLL